MEWDIKPPHSLVDHLKKSKVYNDLEDEYIHDLIKIIINSIIKQLLRKKKVEIRKFGSFKITKYKPPSTIHKIHFKSYLNNRINNK